MDRGFSGGMFDFNRDGKMDAFEGAAECQYLDDIVFADDSSDGDSDDLDEDDNLYVSTPAKIYPNTKNQSHQTPHEEQESIGATILKAYSRSALLSGRLLCAFPVKWDN